MDSGAFSTQSFLSYYAGLHDGAEDRLGLVLIAVRRRRIDSWAEPLGPASRTLICWNAVEQEADDLKIERQLIFVRSAERIGIDRSSAAREQRLLVSDSRQ
jgi:hypothetical protein